jgi:hypothetical protein
MITQIYWVGDWFEVDETTLKRGDLFRQYNDDGTPVIVNGSHQRIVSSVSLKDWETVLISDDTDDERVY